MHERKLDDFIVVGLPETAPPTDVAICRSRLLTAAREIAGHAKTAELVLLVGTSAAVKQLVTDAKGSTNAEADGRVNRYAPRDPLYTFDHLVIPHQVREEIISAIDLLRVESVVFDEWGLRAVEPFPRTALNFHGPPGTGKTLAAHALAHRLSRKILVASYAEIESKYHGDGPKNVKAIFAAAERNQAVLFIDEADSLLSRRLLNVTQGSEQAINSMRSQLLICLEQFSGVVIFSTNLVENYDKAFETRVRHIRFELPDENCRAEIWRHHLVPRLPLSADVNPTELAHRVDDICGRDIKNAVIDAAVRVAIQGKRTLTLDDFISAIERIKRARIVSDGSRQLRGNEATEVAQRVRAALLENQSNPTSVKGD
ncbi:MAG TPA: ATP-binding protein [Archangium sp.]|nr:ATP-binding protein [Archangium sp.]